MRIGFIAPYQDLAALVKEISAEMNLPVDVFLGALDEGVEILHRLETKGYDIVLSRGATFGSIARNSKIPVLNCGITFSDILYALYEAKAISKNIALIVPETIVFNYSLITKIFNINLVYLTAYSSIEELQSMVQEAVDRKAEVVVGGVLTVKYAQELGLRGILLQTSAETVRQALKNACDMVNFTRAKLLEAERLKQLIEFSYDGIIMTDASGVVTVFNPAAERIMNIDASVIMNEKVEKHLPTTKMFEVLMTGEPQLGSLQKVNNTTIITNRIPIRVKDEVLGVVSTFQDVNKIQDWELTIRSELYQKGLVAKYVFTDYIGSCDAVRRLISKARKYTTTDSTILITGESGTGKEILAQSIHNASRRKDFPFVAVNCSAIPEALLESELFGYEEGAFTGAKKGGKVGLFELAHKGTIFLDEIGSVSKSLQANLLRVLQEKEVWRISSNKVIKVDVRVIAATNSDLSLEVEKGTFRQDLYYRLNVLSLQTIPLRDRTPDIPELFYALARDLGISPGLSKEEERLLKEYSWPGNVRELQNLVERFVLLGDEVPLLEMIKELVDRPTRGGSVCADEEARILGKSSLYDMENEIIEFLLREYEGNSTIVAERLKISRTTLWKRMKALRQRCS